MECVCLRFTLASQNIAYFRWAMAEWDYTLKNCHSSLENYPIFFLLGWVKQSKDRMLFYTELIFNVIHHNKKGLAFNVFVKRQFINVHGYLEKCIFI